MTQYFKFAKVNGFDCHTGKTINYRNNIGKTVSPPGDNKDYDLCSNSVLHASKDVFDALKYVSIPFSLYKVSGTPIVKGDDKVGFAKMNVLKEIPEKEFDKLLGFNYSEAVNPFDPRSIKNPKVTEQALEILKMWDSVRGSVRDSVWDSVWDSETAYIGSLFYNIETWKYTDKLKLKKNQYPFQPSVDLTKQGLIPVYYQDKWHLFTGKGKMLWEGTV